MRLANNLIEIHYKILDNVKDNMAPFIELLIKAPYERKLHWRFCLFLDPRYAEDLKYRRELRGVEGVHIKTVIFEMKDKFLDYVFACENLQNYIVVPISSTVQEASIYSEDEGASPAIMPERQTNLYIDERLAQEFRTFLEAAKESGTVKDFLGWYQERKLQFPMLTRFSTMIFDIPPSQAKNERDFSLAGVFTGSNRARILVDMI